MAPDYLDLYERASAWTAEKVDGASDQLEASTPCEAWTVRELLDHMLDTQLYFLGQARGDDVPPPSPTPPALISGDPRGYFEGVRERMLAAYQNPSTMKQKGPALGIAFADQLLHGWDVAQATGQDTTMPAGLPEAAYETIHGQFTDEQRAGLFKPEVTVPANAKPQDKLLAFTGRHPS